MRVISDNPAIEKHLVYLADEIRGQGGHLDADIIIRCREGQLTVEKSGFANPRQPMIALPCELMLPVSRLGVTVKDGQFALDPDRQGISDRQRKLAETMFQLYNLTNKIPYHRQTCCWFVFRDDPELFKQLMSARSPNPALAKQFAFTEGKSGQDENEFLCETYLKTRIIGCKHAEVDFRPESGDSKPASEFDFLYEKPVVTTDIMPIVDFMNHHYQTAGFNFTDEYQKDNSNRRFLLVQADRPLNSNECFAFYNPLDALDAYCRYGFVDVHAPIVRSIPLVLEFPKFGKVTFRSNMAINKKLGVSPSLTHLWRFMPVTAKRSPAHLELTHINIPCDPRLSDLLRAALKMIFSEETTVKKRLTSQEIIACTLEAEEKIIDANVQFYQNLLKLAQPPKGTDESRQQAIVREIAEVQLGKIHRYHFHKDSLRFQND